MATSKLPTSKDMPAQRRGGVSPERAATTNPPTLERHLGGDAVSLMHFLQRSIGNQATLRLLRRKRQDRVIEPAQCPPHPFNMRGRIPHKLLHRLRLSSGRPQPNVLRRQSANQPDEPLDVALARQDLLDRIAEDNRKLREQLDAAQVGIAERDVQVAPFFVQEDPEIQRTQRQIASGRAQVPARLAKLQQSLTLAAKAALRESDNLDQLRAKITLVQWLNSFTPALLRDTAEYEALLKQQKAGERDYADAVAFFEGIRRQIEITKAFLPERAAHLAERSRFLQDQATSAARRAGIGPDTQASAGQLALLRTVIEASPTLRPYLTQQRAEGRQPTDLRNAGRFIIHSRESDLQDEAQKRGIAPSEPGKKIGGFYDRPTDTIHLPPNAQFGTALHESIHKYSQIFLRNACNQFLNEGLTQYFADIVLTDQGLPKFMGHEYGRQLACATRFINTYHLDEVAPAYFLGFAGLGAGRLHQFLLTQQCHAFCAPEQGAAGH